MKVALTLDNFPMRLVDILAKELKTRLPSVDIQVGGGSTVFVSFATPDIVKVQELSIICDKYCFGDDDDGGSILCEDET